MLAKWQSSVVAVLVLVVMSSCQVFGGRVTVTEEQEAALMHTIRHLALTLSSRTADTSLHR